MKSSIPLKYILFMLKCPLGLIQMVPESQKVGYFLRNKLEKFNHPNELLEFWEILTNRLLKRMGTLITMTV